MSYKNTNGDETGFASRYVPVFKNSDRDYRIAYDPVRGMYCLGFDEFWKPDPEYDSVMWPSEFSRTTGWLDVREPPHLIYEPEGTYDDFISGTEREYRVHLVRDGKILCNNPMIVPSPESEELIPLSEFSEEELLCLHGQMCSNCPDIDDILSEGEK